MKTLLIILSLLVSLPASMVQQSKSAREAIGLDLSVPNYDTRTIDANVMGPRLAGILDMLLASYRQITYQRMLSNIIKEQNPEWENLFFTINSLKFTRAQKQGDEITIWIKIRTDQKMAAIKDLTLALHFRDGVSDSRVTNELFKYISHYVQMKEELAKQL